MNEERRKKNNPIHLILIDEEREKPFD